MLPRLTAQTALAVVRQLGQDLSKWIEEGGNLGPSSLFQQSYEELDDVAQQRHLRVEVTRRAADGLMALGLEPDQSIPLQVGTGRAELQLTEADLMNAPSSRVGSAEAPVFVFAPPDINSPEEEMLETYLGERPVAILQAPPEQTARWGARGSWQLESAPDDRALRESVLGRVLQPEGEMLLDLLISISVLKGLESLSGGLELAIEQELRGLKARKAMTLQKVSRSQQRGPAMGNDIQVELRQRLQRHQVDFERGVLDRLQALLTPQTGRLTQLIEEKLNDLKDLDRVKKSRSVGVEIPEQFQQELLDTLRREVHLQLRSDLVAEKDLFGVISKELESFLESRGGPPVVPQFQFLPEDRPQRLMDQSLFFQRRYSGEVPKMGVFEYAMAARRYLTLLFMGLSAFGLLTFFRRSLVIMLPVSFLLLVIGGLLAVRSSKQEHSDVLDRELERARELLRSELRRGLGDILRVWPSMIAQHLSEQFQQLQQQVDSAMRDHTSMQSSEAAEEKQRIQRQLQILENTEKKLVAAARGREVVDKAILQVKGELKQLLGTLIKQPGKVA